MGTIERGESNLSFQNIAKVANTLDISLSTLFLDLEGHARILATQSTGSAPAKASKRTRMGRTETSNY